MKIYQGFFFICCAFAIWIGIAAVMDYFYPKEQDYYISCQLAQNLSNETV